MKKALCRLKIVDAKLMGVMLSSMKEPKGVMGKYHKDYRKYSYKDYEYK